MQFVKVLDKDLRPPFQGGKPYEIGVWHHCENFDTSNAVCAPGFYVIPVSELIHYHKPWNDTKVLPVEVKGNSKILFASKQRYEYMKLGNPLSDDEIKALCREIEPELGYKLSEALYPVNPLLLPKATVTDADIKLLKQWSSIKDSVGDSVWDSVNVSTWNSVWDSVWHSIKDSVGDSVWKNVGDSIKDSVGDSVWHSIKDSVGDSVRSSVWHSIKDSVGDSVWKNVEDSVWDSVMAYIGSLFPGVEKWKYVDHEPGVYPFQPAVDLWHRGLITVFDGNIWRLYSGEKAEVVWEEPKAGWLKAQEEEGE